MKAMHLPRAMLVAALYAGVAFVAGPALAQQEAAKEEVKKENPLPPSGSAGGPSHPDQNAKQESSSKVDGTSPVPDILVNGVLSVPGAPTDVDTAPAKFSARTAADDALPIAGYRFKHLTDEQRRTIRESIGGRSAPGAGSRALDGFAAVGAEVPTAVALDDLKPIPEAVAARVPGLDGTTYTLSEGRVILVNTTTRVVVAVLD